MEEKSHSVYSLITNLCELYTPNRNKIKSVRSNCYEVLLKKKLCGNPRKFKDLQGSKEPMHNLLAWCFRLTYEFDCSENAQKLEKLGESLRQDYDKNPDNFNNILTLLLCLKDLPTKTNEELDLSSLPEISNEISMFDKMFKLNYPLTEDTLESQPSSMFSRVNSDSFKEINNAGLKNSPSLSLPLEIVNDEGYSSPVKENIWEMVSKMQFSKRRCWESYGCGPPDKEKPFLSELGELSSLWVDNLESLYMAINLFPSFTVLNNKMKSRKDFIRDLKYLLVGMQSETFNLDSREEFFISPGIIVEGITPDAIDRFCSGFIFAGTCYRALNHMTTPDAHTRKYKYLGYVFKEFCQSLYTYLQFYRTAICSISDNINFLALYEKTYQFQVQVSTLASICKIGPYAKQSEEMPHGVALLNYLYQKVLGLCDKKLCMVLYSLLYPCCQTYLNRFLLPWIKKGILNDPHGEFFIIPNLKYLSTKGRTYWTRSYGIRADILPDFLIDLENDILFCGKIMNLLQICAPTNKLCLCMKGKNLLVLTCCLTHEKLAQIRQSASKYFLHASSECGPKFTFDTVLEKSKETDISFLHLVAKKRAITLRRLELERQKAEQEHQERKLEEVQLLKEQYESALQQKELRICKEIQKEVAAIEEDLKIEEMRAKLIQEESSRMLDYYTELCKSAEERKEKIEKHVKTINNIQIDVASSDILKSQDNSTQEKTNSSTESFYSVQEDAAELEKEESCVSIKEEVEGVRSSQSMDLLNANIEEDPVQTCGDKLSGSSTNPTVNQALENFRLARQIKQKVLNQEMGISLPELIDEKTKLIKQAPVNATLTAAQRNKLKVLSSEFGIEVIKQDSLTTDRVLTIAQLNRNKVLGHSACFNPEYGTKVLDNHSFVNRNVSNVSNKIENCTAAVKKSKSLQLNLEAPNSKPEFDRPIPMSVDSTPLSEIPAAVTPSSDLTQSVTPSSMFLSIDTKIDSTPTTASTRQTDDVFDLNFIGGSSLHSTLDDADLLPHFSKRVTTEEAKSMSNNSLKLFLHESVSIPLLTQLKLANNEILKYFVEELRLLDHLRSLRDYFFMQDGEFGRNITENLFEKLYRANFPLELINFRTLQCLVFSALDSSQKDQDNSKYLSFKINSLPKCFDLGDPDVLDCLSLTYNVKWPLNILVPSDALAKYDNVFKFLVKLNRVSWVLKKIFLELKILAKETGKKEIYLMASPQYRHLHQCRHVMGHFMQTLQNYIVGEVLQPSWEMFERRLISVTNIEDLYNAHATYIRDITFRCMLNQKSVALKNIFHKIFVVILKFYDYMRSRQWVCVDGAYVHPNYSKLDNIFKNFEEFVVYLFKVVRKVTKCGYQPHLSQFLELLNVNEFYSKKLSHAVS